MTVTARTAAEFFWSHRLELTAGPSRRAHLRTYLERHADHGPPDLQLIAEAELAPELALCFEGFGRIYGEQYDPLVEFTGRD